MRPEEQGALSLAEKEKRKAEGTYDKRFRRKHYNKYAKHLMRAKKYATVYVNAESR